jgi:1,4-alpha-glucan branching enzyme
MGGMHDTLDRLGRELAHRLRHRDRMTFGLICAITASFVRPDSHDEVIHVRNTVPKRSGECDA